jgi:diguanylate cyclase (GGDEF)-like protein/PAS domain S-box-containing protein
MVKPMTPQKEIQNTFVNLPDRLLKKWQEIADLLAELLSLKAALILKIEKDFLEVFVSSNSVNNPFHVGDKENMSAYQGYPINFPDNQPFGALYVLDNPERHFSLHEEKLLQKFKNILELDLALIQSFNIKTDEQVKVIREQRRRSECLYAISELVANPKSSFDESVKSLVDIIPTGWRYSKIICVKIICEGREFKSPNFKDTARKQSVDIKVLTKTVGKVEVGFLEERSKPDHESFTQEERNMLLKIARQIGVMIERQHAEDGLRQSEGEMRAIYSALSDIVLVYDREMTVKHSNPNFLLIYGLDPIGLNLRDIIQHVNCRLLDNQPLEWSGLPTPRALRGEKVDSVIFRVTQANGEEAIVESSSCPMFVGGRITGSVTAWHDITARVRAEDEVRRGHTSVLEEKKHLSAVFEVLPVGVAILNDQGGTIQSNKAYDQIWGTSRPNVKIIADYAPYKAWWVDTGKRVEPEEWASAQAIQKGEMVIGQYMEIERFNGTHLFVLNSGVPIQDELGHITGAAVAIMDVTPLKQMQAELGEAKELLRKANLELNQALEREKLISRTDSLTAVHNRRYFFEIANHEYAEAKRYGHSLSMIMFDIDHFKQFNDVYGHQAGDEVLKQVTQIAGQQLRDADILARYGGEEFVILLPNTTASETAILAERIRESISAAQMQIDGKVVNITISLGIAECQAPTPSLESLVQETDKAMYAAKKAGRNCVKIFST